MVHSCLLFKQAIGLMGQRASVSLLPSTIWLWMAAVVIGGLLGTQLGTRYLAVPAMRRLLGVVLVIAGVKMFLELQKPRASPPPSRSAAYLVTNLTEQPA